MVTFRGVLREIEREQKRSAREAARRHKLQMKQQEIENAADAVKTYSAYIEMLQSVHRNCTNNVDWNRILKDPKPQEPEYNKHEIEAISTLDNYTPTIVDKLFGLNRRRIKRLVSNIDEAKQRDNQSFKSINKKYKSDLADWANMQGIANGVKAKDVDSYCRALQYFTPFSDIAELGTNVELSFYDNYVDADLKIHPDETIPDYILTQTSTGKLSRRNMPKSKFNEIYQDHVCSAIIRVSRELFAYLPIDYVRVNAISDLLNSRTGHLEPSPIVSVIMPPETISKLNLDAIDPSDSMQNFNHNMKFTKLKGFAAVDKVQFIDEDKS